LQTGTLIIQILQHATSPCLALRLRCQPERQNLNKTKRTLRRDARITAVRPSCLFLCIMSLYCNIFRLVCKRLSPVR